MSAFKKIFQIILIIVILAALGLGIYWLFDRSQGGDGLSFNPSNISIGDFFPFGNSGPTDTGVTPGTGTPTPGDQNTPAGTGDQTPVPPPRLWQISTNPASGAVVFNASNTPIVRFVDKATGNIFESSLEILGTKRISNTTIPKVYEAIWQPSGKGVFIRYLDDNNETIKTTLGVIASTTTVVSTEGQNGGLETIHELTTSFLPNNITDIATNRNTGALAFVVRGQTSAQIFVANTSGANPKLVYESGIKDQNISWADNTTLSLAGKPSAGATNQLYFLKTDTLGLSRILGNKPGLIALSNPTGTKVFYSESTNNSFVSKILDPKTGVETKTPFNTLPDKCVWSTKTSYLYCATPRSITAGQYPDAWYQGKVTFTDDIWRLDTSSGAAEFLIDPSSLIQNGLDATNLALDPNENYLVFTNKKDAHLWGLRISK